MIFVGLPFVVRTVQPVLLEIDVQMEEAAATLGATPLQTVCARDPARGHRRRALTGFALAFARAVGEYGSIVFISGQHADEDRDRAAADRHQAGAVRLRGRDGAGAGDAGGVVRACCWSSTRLQAWIAGAAAATQGAA